MEDLMDLLIEDVKNMTIDDYLAYHEEALLMKKHYEDMISNMTVYQTSLIKERAISKKSADIFKNMSIDANYTKISLIRNVKKEVQECLSVA